MIYGIRDLTEYEGEREFIVPDRPTCEACHGEAEFKNGTWRRRCRWCSGSVLTGRDGKRSRRHQLRLRDAWRKEAGMPVTGAAVALKVTDRNFTKAWQARFGR